MDSFFGIGLFELVMIAVIALVVLGPERLPGAMREVAKYMKQLRSISHEFQSQFSEELKMLEEIDPRRILNEAIDPNAPANTTAAKPPAQAATAAKPAAARLPPRLCRSGGGSRSQARCAGRQARWRPRPSPTANRPTPSCRPPRLNRRQAHLNLKVPPPSAA